MQLSDLRCRFWRLNNLYWIKDKNNKPVKFKMTTEQLAYYEGKHSRNVILKARQLGFTTEECIMQLDAALFMSNACAMIAHKLDDAKRIFREKIKFAYDRLPDLIKEANPCRNDRSGELSFANGGYISVSTSFRGGTLNSLHVSEFGKICARHPDKAEEIVTGAFEAVSKGGTITLESTAEGSSGYFYNYCKEAEKKHLSQDALGLLDWKFFFFSWWENAEYSLDEDGDIISDLVNYFDKLEAEHGIKLSEGQKLWYQAKHNDLGENVKREYPSVPSEAFEQSIKGAYYARQFTEIYRTGRIGKLPDNDHLEVHTYWDFGVGDSTAIWFARKVGSEYHFIDYYENSGEGLEHYAKILMDKGYNYAPQHNAPHDVDNRQFAAKGAKSLKEIAREGFDIDGQLYKINFATVPKNSIAGGIEKARTILKRCYFDKVKCEKGIKCLENYRKEWDEKRSCFRDVPLHDWASHGADAFRYFAESEHKVKQQITESNPWG